MEPGHAAAATASTAAAAASAGLGSWSCSSLLDDEQLRSFVRVERCPLCGRTARAFFCRLCVQAGEFSHSRSATSDGGCGSGEKLFAAGRLQLFRARHELVTHAITLEDGTEARRRRQQLLRRLDAAVRRRRATAAAVVSAGRRLAATQQRLTVVRQRCEALRQRQPALRARLAQMSERQANAAPAATARAARRLQSTRRLADAAARGALAQLTAIIFPVHQQRGDEQSAKRSSDVAATVVERAEAGADERLTATERALAEAQSLSHVHGRWVQLDARRPRRCSRWRVVQAVLPECGDLSTYGVWAAAVVSYSSGGGGSRAVSWLDNPALNTTAALGYVAQLVNIAACYMAVHLPNRLCYSRFCLGNSRDGVGGSGGGVLAPPSERRLHHLAAVLHANLVCLCWRAGVSVDHLSAVMATAEAAGSLTVKLLLLLLNSQQLRVDAGRWLCTGDGTDDQRRRRQQHRRELQLLEDVEATLRADLDGAGDAASLSDSDGDAATLNGDSCNSGGGGDESAGGEWEQVPLEVPSVTETAGALSMAAAGTSASVATALVSNAAASVASFFRGLHR